MCYFYQKLWLGCTSYSTKTQKVLRSIEYKKNILSNIYLSITSITVIKAAPWDETLSILSILKI